MPPIILLRFVFFYFPFTFFHFLSLSLIVSLFLLLSFKGGMQSLGMHLGYKWHANYHFLSLFFIVCHCFSQAECRPLECILATSPSDSCRIVSGPLGTSLTLPPKLTEWKVRKNDIMTPILMELKVRTNKIMTH